MNDEIVEVPEPKGNSKKKKGSTQIYDPQFASWLERQFRNEETPQSIDAYPLFKGRDREERLYHYDVKGTEVVDAERAAELSNEIWSDCQLHCDRLPRTSLSKEGSKTYQISVIDDRRGGLAQSVGTHLLKLMPRISGPAPTEDDDADDISSEDTDNLVGKKMIVEVFREISGSSERNQATLIHGAGDVMMLLKDGLKDSFSQNRELHKSQLEMMGEFREMIREEGRRRVEEKAVAIDAANAEVEREARRAQLTKENMWTNVMQASMLEGVKILGHLFPGFGQLFSALIAGKPIPSPPGPLGSTNGAGAIPAGGQPGGQPQLPPASPGEKELVDRFIDTAEKTKVAAAGDDTTLAEKLFGKDDAQGKPLDVGVFTREQVGILTGVHMGSLGIEALDALLPESGKPEAVNGLQIAKAIAICTPDMIADISKVLEMRKAKKL